MARPLSRPALAFMVLVGAFGIVTYLNTHDPTIFIFCAIVIGAVYLVAWLVSGSGPGGSAAHVHCASCGRSASPEMPHCGARGATLPVAPSGAPT